MITNWEMSFNNRTMIAEALHGDKQTTKLTQEEF